MRRRGDLRKIWTSQRARNCCRCARRARGDRVEIARARTLVPRAREFIAIYQDDAVGSLVVGRGDGLESLLAGGVPDLQFHGLSLEVEGSDFEVDSDGREEALVENVIGESEQQGRFSDSRVANQQQIEEVIVVLL